MPNAAALERGSEVGRLVLEAHRSANGGALPETVAVNLWGLDAIKTKVIETQYSGYTTPQGFLSQLKCLAHHLNPETVAINLWGQDQGRVCNTRVAGAYCCAPSLWAVVHLRSRGDRALLEVDHTSTAVSRSRVPLEVRSRGAQRAQPQSSICRKLLQLLCCNAPLSIHLSAGRVRGDRAAHGRGAAHQRGDRQVRQC